MKRGENTSVKWKMVGMILLYWALPFVLMLALVGHIMADRQEKTGLERMAGLYRKPAILFILPAFLFMIVYLYYPFFRNIINSFQQIGRLGTPETEIRKNEI